MAKELCMIQRTDKGKLAREYFLSIEKAWNSPEMIMNRALKLADESIKKLQIDNSNLLGANAIMKPKAEYYDELVDCNHLTNFRDTAKELQIGEKIFIKFLLDNGYVYYDYKKNLKPYAKNNKGLFELKDVINEKTGWSGVQTLITLKGKISLGINLGVDNILDNWT